MCMQGGSACLARASLYRRPSSHTAPARTALKIPGPTVWIMWIIWSLFYSESFRIPPKYNQGIALQNCNPTRFHPFLTDSGLRTQVRAASGDAGMVLKAILEHQRGALVQLVVLSYKGGVCSGPQTLHPKPQTLNPKPQTLNPKPQLHPKPLKALKPAKRKKCAPRIGKIQKLEALIRRQLLKEAAHGLRCLQSELSRNFGGRGRKGPYLVDALNLGNILTITPTGGSILRIWPYSSPLTHKQGTMTEAVLAMPRYSRRLPFRRLLPKTLATLMFAPTASAQIENASNSARRSKSLRIEMVVPKVLNQKWPFHLADVLQTTHLRKAWAAAKGPA